MTRRYSLLSLIREALRGNRGWAPAWRDREPASSYDVLVGGGGGHGLATAYYLAKKHGVRRIAVLEKGWIGGGNSGRNTQVTRSNYFYPVSSAFYDHSLKLYEGLGSELNFNVMLSQRGVINLAHSEHDLEMIRRWANAIRMNGVDSEMLTPAQVKKRVPLLNLNCRYPIVGGFNQLRAGISRHDAVVWGFARGANALGVDIVQGCEVKGFHITSGRVQGVDTSRGRIAAPRVVMSVAGHASVLAHLAGWRTRCCKSPARIAVYAMSRSSPLEARRIFRGRP
jgi:sarcosine oxidase subunit beta